MTVEVSVLISGLAAATAIYFGLAGYRRNQKSDIKSDTTEMTTVIVKLENISNMVTEIKSDMAGIKNDVKEVRERIVRVEESAKQAHKRIDEIKKQEE